MTHDCIELTQYVSFHFKIVKFKNRSIHIRHVLKRNLLTLNLVNIACFEAKCHATKRNYLFSILKPNSDTIMHTQAYIYIIHIRIYT